MANKNLYVLNLQFCTNNNYKNLNSSALDDIKALNKGSRSRIIQRTEERERKIRKSGHNEKETASKI